LSRIATGQFLWTLGLMISEIQLRLLLMKLKKVQITL